MLGRSVRLISSKRCAVPGLVHGVINQHASQSAQKDTEANRKECKTRL